MTTIQNSLKFIFEEENIQSKANLDNWCGAAGRKKLYGYIARLSPVHYARLQKPDKTICGIYQTLLTGFKRSPGYLRARHN